jgi:hypothetical protein
VFILGSPAPCRPPVHNSHTAQRVAAIIVVAEEFGGWILGHLVSDPSVSVELGFEQWDKFLANDWTLLGTSIVYLRMDRGKERLFEHQFRQTITQPKNQAILKVVRDLVALFRDYEPRILPPRSYPYELPLHTLSQRQDLGDRQPTRRGRLRRRRECEVCGARFTTREVPIEEIAHRRGAAVH